MALHLKENRNNLLQPGREKRQGDFAKLFFFTKDMLIVNEVALTEATVSCS